MNVDRPIVDSLSIDAPARPSAAVGSVSDHSTAAFTPGDTVTTRIAETKEAGQFGRYRLERLLGQGGMGEVHLAHDSLLQRTVALKIPKFANDTPIQRERFLREARASALLSHPNICPVYDVNEVDGRPYMTMGFIDGPTLSSRIRRAGPLEPHESAKLIRSVALAMKHAHDQGILHRDLKPGNILINPQGEPIVMDFGLAFRFDSETNERLTEQGLVVGTPAYMPPEQVNCLALTPAADVYSLGVVLYELLTGKLPFEGPLGKLLAQIESAAPPRPSELRPEIEPALEAICLKALAKKPAERFLDMGEFAEALDDYVRGKSTLVNFAPPTLIFRSPPRRRRAVLLGALLVGLTATAAVVWVRRVDVAPVPPMQMSDADRLFDALVKPLVKIDCEISDAAPVHLGRQFIPPHLLQLPAPDGNGPIHDGPLYFSVSGRGSGHVLDLSDQPGQGGQITHFGGEITVKAPYLLFVGSVAPSARVYIKGGIGYSILAPMDGGAGCKHIEFDGTHLLEPKFASPKTETTEATGAERETLRNPDLIQKMAWKYAITEYVIYCRPGTQVVPGNHELRKQQFPAVYDIIEADRKRQSSAHTISNTRLQQALREVGS